jgi:DNA-binding CsgD family transcriptional regulator
MKLTARELQCLSGIANGLMAEAIGHALGINFRTVEKHLASARLKLKAKTTAHAVAIATELGLVSVIKGKWEAPSYVMSARISVSSGLP